MSSAIYVDSVTSKPFVLVIEDCTWGAEKERKYYNIKGLELVDNHVEFYGSNCGEVSKFDDTWKVDMPMSAPCYIKHISDDFDRIFSPRQVILYSFKYLGNGEILYKRPLGEYFTAEKKIILEDQKPIVVFEVRGQEINRFSSPNLTYSKGHILYKGYVCGKLEDNGRIVWERKYAMNCVLYSEYDEVNKLKTVYLIPSGFFYSNKL